MKRTLADLADVDPSRTTEPPTAAAVTEPREARTLDTFTLRTALTDPSLLAPPEPVVAPFLYAGRTTLLSAREKTGKTTLASGAAAALTRGGVFLGEQLSRSRVLWITLDEGMRDTARRFHLLGADPDLLVLTKETPNAATLRATLEDSYFRLVVIDTLNELCLGRSLNDSRDVLPILRPIVNVIQESSTACLIIGHAGKASGGYLGSTTIGGAVDAPLTLKKVASGAAFTTPIDPGSENEDDDAADDGRRILVGPTRWGGRLRVRLAFDGTHYALGSAPLPLDRRILTELAKGPSSATQLADALHARKSSVLDTMALLEAKGFLNRGQKSSRITAAGSDSLRTPEPHPEPGRESVLEHPEPARNHAGPEPEPHGNQSSTTGSQNHKPRVVASGTGVDPDPVRDEAA